MDNTTPWRILIVDDEEGVHAITRMIFRGYQFEDRPVELISALSGAQARAKLLEQPDICLALLDVVMESDDEGLRLVDYIRSELGNRDMRIILRTGHPGLAPEIDVIVTYDLNDYLSKSELSASRLLTSVIVALRSYRDICLAHQSPTPPLASPVGPEAQERFAPAARPLLKQSQHQLQRLRQLELSPMARDLLQELNCSQLRLQSLLQLTAPEPLNNRAAQPVDPRRLIETLVGDMLPLARQQRRLLDYRFDPQLPERLTLPAEACIALWLGLLDHALSPEQGPDLRLSLDYDADRGQLALTLEGDVASAAGGSENPQQKLWRKSGLAYWQTLANSLGGSLLLLADEPTKTLIRCSLAAEVSSH